MTKCKECGRPIRWAHNKKGQLLPLERDIDVEHGLFCGVDIPYPGWPAYPPISGGGSKKEIMFPDTTSPDHLEPLPGFRCGDCLYYGSAIEYDDHYEYPHIRERCRLHGHQISTYRIACQFFEGPGRCACGCGLPVPDSPTRPRLYFSNACRQRAYRAREKEKQPHDPQD